MKLHSVSFFHLPFFGSLLCLLLTLGLWLVLGNPLCGYLALSIACCYLAIAAGGLVILMTGRFLRQDLSAEPFRF